MAILRILSLSVFALLALSQPHELDVRLAHIDGSRIRVSVTNKATRALRLPKPDTILDSLPVRKVSVTVQGLALRQAPKPADKTLGKPIEFHGPKLFIDPKRLSDNDFVTLAPGQTVRHAFDLSTTYELPQNTAIDLRASSIIPYSGVDSTKILGHIKYISNTLTIKLNQTSSHAKLERDLTERAILPTDCDDPSKVNAISEAIKLAQNWTAVAVREAPKPDTPAWKEYFRFTNPDASITKQYHSIVTTRFQRILSELAATPRGRARIYCDHNAVKLPQNEADSCLAYPNATIAFTLGPTCQVALCPLFWSIPAVSDSCRKDSPHDRPMVFIHELVHCTQIGTVGLQPVPEDFAYNYHDMHDDEIMPPGWSLQNAQSYCLFAKAVAGAGADC